MHLRRQPLVAALLLVLALLAAACSGGDDDGAGPSDTTSPTTAVDGGSDDGSDDGSGGGGDADGGDDGETVDVAIPDPVLAAPPDCVVNPYCGQGLREHYGIDVRRSLLPVEPGEALARVIDGEAMVGVVFTADPEITTDPDPRLLVLEDDDGMVGAEHIVPVAPLAKALPLGPAFVETVDAVSAALTTEDLAFLVGRAEEGDLPTVAIRAWVDEHGPFGEQTGTGDVTIAAQSFLENRILAELYAAALADAGYTTSVLDVQGYRPNLVDAVVFGDVTLGIEYAASATEFLSGFSGVATADIAETVETLRQYAALRDIVVFDPSPAESANAFVMRADVAQELGIRSLSDLAGQFPAVEPVPEGERPANLGLGSSPDDPGVGDTGQRIVQLELRLIALGYNPGPADGVFDQLTREAVAAFQTCKGLAPDGVVGPVTQAALDAGGECVTPPTTTTTTPTGGGGGTGTTVPPANGSVVYFTFDDGPHPTYTPQVLDVLARYGAKGTFFVVGQQVGPQAAIVGRMLREGHAVQNHTWAHPDLTKVGRDQFFSEITATNDAIVAAGGRRPGCLRPPYGARNSSVDGWAAEAGLRITLWQVDPQDWRRPGVDVIVDNIVRFARPGSVILLHDGGGNREQSVAALDRALSRLSSAGYRFEAVAC